MSGETDLFDGVMGLLTAAELGVWSADAVYADSDVWAIVMGEIPQTPSLIVALTTYVVSDDPVLNDSLLAVQVMLRGTGDLRSVKDQSAAIFNVLQGLENRDFGSIHLAQMWRQSGRLDGKDKQQRWLSSENYYCRVNWPTANRTD